ncbi:MAG: AAA family ATPase, partial [Burkholderiaceae bacterium]|nr:AAA family ATPase [Burkholderiaceae bacterium]
MTNPLFSWQTASWAQLQSMRARMPHAILLYGPEGIGKTSFAEHLAQSLLCETPDAAGHACGACASCGWFVQYSHPDYRRVRPELLEQEDALADESNSSAEDGEKTSAAKASKAPS